TRPVSYHAGGEFARPRTTAGRLAHGLAVASRDGAKRTSGVTGPCQLPHVAALMRATGGYFLCYARGLVQWGCHAHPLLLPRAVRRRGQQRLWPEGVRFFAPRRRRVPARAHFRPAPAPTAPP